MLFYNRSCSQYEFYEKNNRIISYSLKAVLQECQGNYIWMKQSKERTKWERERSFVFPFWWSHHTINQASKEKNPRYKPCQCNSRVLDDNTGAKDHDSWWLYFKVAKYVCSWRHILSIIMLFVHRPFFSF